jgi:hypothetical protein
MASATRAPGGFARQAARRAPFLGGAGPLPRRRELHSSFATRERGRLRIRETERSLEVSYREQEAWGGEVRMPRWLRRMLRRPEALADTPEAAHEKRKAQPGRSIAENADRAAVAQPEATPGTSVTEVLARGQRSAAAANASWAASSASSKSPRKAIRVARTRLHSSRKTRSRIATAPRSVAPRRRRQGGPPGSARRARSRRRGRRPRRTGSRRAPP